MTLDCYLLCNFAEITFRIGKRYTERAYQITRTPTQRFRQPLGYTG